MFQRLPLLPPTPSTPTKAHLSEHYSLSTIAPLRMVSISQSQMFPYAFLSHRASSDASSFICCQLFAPPGGLLGWEIRGAQQSSFLHAAYHLHGKQLHVNFPSKYWKFQPPGVGASPLQRAVCHPVSFFRISRLRHLQVTSQISSLLT